jgi:hypothetical protein
MLIYKCCPSYSWRIDIMISTVGNNGTNVRLRREEISDVVRSFGGPITSRVGSPLVRELASRYGLVEEEEQKQLLLNASRRRAIAEGLAHYFGETSPMSTVTNDDDGSGAAVFRVVSIDESSGHYQEVFVGSHGLLHRTGRLLSVVQPEPAVASKDPNPLEPYRYMCK